MRLHQDWTIDRTGRFALLVLLYLERQGLVPERFTPAGQAIWRGIMPYARPLDLFELAVRDGTRANPHLFAALVDGETRSELRALDETAWRQELERLAALVTPQTPARSLYRWGAEALGLDLPPIREPFPPTYAFDRSSLIAELPNGCGYPSLLLCQAYPFLDAAHNLRIFAEGQAAEMLAAWALVLLTRTLAPPPERIVAVSAADHEALRRESFDAALLYRPVEWLPKDVAGLVQAREVIAL